MALIKCPECGKEISDKAMKCPGCGHQIVKTMNNDIEQNKSKTNEKGNGEVGRKSHKGLIITLVSINIIILGMLIAAVIYLYTEHEYKVYNLGVVNNDLNEYEVVYGIDSYSEDDKYFYVIYDIESAPFKIKKSNLSPMGVKYIRESIREYMTN